MQVHLYQAAIERNLYTKTVVTVPRHEVEILLHLFGADRIDAEEDAVGVMTLTNPAEEWERLSIKYGRDNDDKPLVSKVYPTQKDFVEAVKAGEAVTKKPRAAH